MPGKILEEVFLFLAPALRPLPLPPTPPAPLPWVIVVAPLELPQLLMVDNAGLNARASAAASVPLRATPALLLTMDGTGVNPSPAFAATLAAAAALATAARLLAVLSPKTSVLLFLGARRTRGAG